MIGLDLSVYLVTDPALCGARGVPAVVAAAVAGGATAVQIRDKHASAAELLATVVAAADAIDAHASAHPTAPRPLLLVDDRVDVVLAALARGARVDGVHVGQSDVPADLVRRMLDAASPDRRLVVGLTANTPAHVEALRALPAGTVDYLGVGVIRPTSTKPDHPAPLGHDGFGIIAGLSPVPCVAIGGVDVRDVDAIAAAGGAGTAVVSAICAAEDPEAAARELAEARARARARPATTGDATDDPAEVVASSEDHAPPLRPVPRVLSIAGTDPTGGAGIQADLKSIAANGGYGMAVVTALVAQNTTGVREIHVPPVAFLRAQLDAVSDDVAIDAVKIGMLGSAAVVDEVAAWLGAVRPPVVVLDPVMVAQSGDALLDADATEALRRLLPLADVVTPNLPELAALLGEREADGWEAALAQGRTLATRHGVRVVVKGGHLRVDDCPDALVTPGAGGAGPTAHVVDGPRIATTSTHGTGCSLSSALATLQPRRDDWRAALTEAKAWLTGSLAHAEDLGVGSGAGPLDHLRALWDAAGTHAGPISAEMWAGSAGLRREIDDLPFVRRLGDGTLPEAWFSHYLAQDAIYLRAYSRVLARASQLAPAPDAQVVWARSAADAIAAESALHEEWLSRHPAPAVAGPVTRAYVDHLLAHAATSDYAVLVAALLPCFTIYADVGTRLRAAGSEAAAAGVAHPYAAWLATYADPAFAEATRRASELVDEAAVLAGPTRRAAMLEASLLSSAYERDFFHAPEALG
ncbi:bifunctional hydroxymethylpyrimidine kinase/phosphomethylpyrimidine kinase [Clavibacter sepedonicus]|uniref:Thiamine-phosphate synthase n=1 Tax=Clavibacter sepedonicus TaxID=31964 RepID=B0RGG3_CLASE|nr:MULTISPECIES: bifunctional hydroxymethylpyrimidine kinase/phosphomethylpyrimidine kinase [Clavibacter]MBD5380945.1 bifunctional hydroxymethylpyrimidine kinase/phosphomethylpyrimidine kinase [Clavibacter sp.]OQJ46962.1 bifunctional hydroxymethylpyrimidine kinase/phosphomethylpyrimidine kinase [Clavibacter sepedonicus]OQJ55148.1 bifunctional hydroxymethylpyrimidine kinase/phosphomethylpyrimidine kinase [Clavibacter sepedonicus]UUK66492.1 bifunctional hydroxymethylpyrimidine kinase/phosphomethy